MWMEGGARKGRLRARGGGRRASEAEGQRLITPTEPSGVSGEWQGAGLPPRATPPPAGQLQRQPSKQGPSPGVPGGHSPGRGFAESCPGHQATVPPPKQPWLYVPTLTQRGGEGVLKHLLTSLSPRLRLASTMKEDGQRARVGVGGERGEEMWAGQHEGPWITCPQLPDGPDTLRHPQCPNTSPPTGKNLNLSMTPAGVKARGQGKEVRTRARRGWGGGRALNPPTRDLAMRSRTASAVSPSQTAWGAGGGGEQGT